MRRPVVLLSALVLLATTVVAGSPAEAAGAQPGCQTDRRTVVHQGGAILGPARGAYEPCLVDTGFRTDESTISVKSDGTLLRSVTVGPNGIAVSRDDGATWQNRKLPSGAFSLIGYSHLDTTTGRFFYSAIGAGPVYSSDDDGLTWRKGKVHEGFLQDWPMIFSGRPVTPRATGYPRNTYYCNWTALYGSIKCYKSTDGGLQFYETTKKPLARIFQCPGGRDNGLTTHGVGLVDPRNGRITVPIMDCGRLWHMVSADEGATWVRHDVTPARTVRFSTAQDGTFNSPEWRKQVLSGRPNIAGAAGSALVQAQTLAMDASGRMYQIWIDDRDLLVHLSTSTDGVTWTPDVVVSAPGLVQATEAAVTATADGRIGLSYYGSTDRWNWTGYLARIDDPAAAAPRIESTAVTRPGSPLMAEPCCWANSLQEWTSVRFGPDGSLWSAFQKYVKSGHPEGMVARLRPVA